MRARMTKEQSSGKQRSKPQKRKATESVKTPSGKPAAKVLDACSPPGYYPSTTVQVTGNSITVTTTTSAHSTPVTSVSTAPVPAATPAHEAANRLAPEPIDPLPSVPDACSPPGYYPSTTVQVTGNSITVTTTTAANSSSVTSVSSTPVLTATPAHDALTPSTPSRPEFSFRSVRPTSGNQLLTYLQGIDAAQGSLMKEVEKLKKQGEATSRKYNEIIDNQRAIRKLLERLVAQGSVPSGITETAEAAQDLRSDGIPDHYTIDEGVLQQMVADSHCPGNFAGKLVLRFFPELFGIGNLRFQYNWYDGGKLQKSELCPVRKCAIRKYVTYYYPDVSSEIVWKERVVPKINELLRRQTRNQRKERRRAKSEVEAENDQAPLTDLSLGTFMNFLNMD
ncbi:uncharacterized protein LOC123528448 [Mercenaria mercenaria]|uniref:uncharacterized protein LOC123528448 n=1 Tax=Mercenaria mercenaria TaxID=6596 RepID=UPI00234EDB52|nr:uncharacterized protein LOC123528448 [Mercenaria mercenaria]